MLNQMHTWSYKPTLALTERYVLAPKAIVLTSLSRRSVNAQIIPGDDTVGIVRYRVANSIAGQDYYIPLPAILLDVTDPQAKPGRINYYYGSAFGLNDEYAGVASGAATPLASDRTFIVI